MTQVAVQDTPAVLEKVVIEGDLSKLSPAERVSYYRRVCETLGLNPFTKPFAYIVLNSKLTLYAGRDATDQLRRRDSISVSITSRETIEGIFVVTAEGKTPDGRVDTSIGAVAIENLKGEARANAMMKAETKSKRRVTLSICGLGWLDETEIDSIPDAAVVVVDTETGEIKEATPQPPPRAGVARPQPTQSLSIVVELQKLAREVGWDDATLKEWLMAEELLDDQGAVLRKALPALQQYVAGQKEPKKAIPPRPASEDLPY